MMIYEYINDETKEVVEAEYPMDGDIPKIITRNGKKYRRNYSKKFPGVIIPGAFTHEDPFNYDQSPSGKKHFY